MRSLRREVSPLGLNGGNPQDRNASPTKVLHRNGREANPLGQLRVMRSESFRAAVTVGQYSPFLGLLIFTNVVELSYS